MNKRASRGAVVTAALRIVITAVVCLSSTAGLVAQTAQSDRLRSVLSAAPHNDVRMGVCVIDLDTGRTVFTRNADQPLIPASSIKVLVMAAALMQLGPEFSFKTVLAVDSHDLIVIGGGDPALGDERLSRKRHESIDGLFQRWAGVLDEHGWNDIPGDLVIDESIFDNQWVHPSWETGDLDNWYAAPVGGLNFNDNCLDITITPAKQVGALVHVTFKPENDLVKIINHCRTGRPGKPILRHPYDSFEYRLTGRCHKRWPFGAVSFSDPGLLFAESFRTVLKKKGIHMAGPVRRKRVRYEDGTVPGSLTQLAQQETPMIDVLRRIGKDSQNLFAECLLKRIGYEWGKRSGVKNPQGSWARGGQAVHEFLDRAGVDTRGLVVADGSGLSRDNACTARQLARVLTWMAARPEGRVMFDSLSVAGVDGSLRKRLRKTPGRVHGKTGTMRGVSALVGYACDTMPCGWRSNMQASAASLPSRSLLSRRESPGRAPAADATQNSSKSTPAASVETTPSPNPAPLHKPAGPRFAFAILFNGYKGPSTPYKQIQDRFCRLLTESPGKISSSR